MLFTCPPGRSQVIRQAKLVRCLIGNGVVVSMTALIKEAEVLFASGVPVFERLSGGRSVPGPGRCLAQCPRRESLVASPSA
ncbi:MAG: hypothetical protein WD795_14960 [Woeseia sp.]